MGQSEKREREGGGVRVVPPGAFALIGKVRYEALFLELVLKLVY